MLNRFFSLDFFLEDHYFQRTLKVNEALEREEKKLGLHDSLFEHSLASFLREKEKVGPRKTWLPSSFTEVPLTVQRKLAREGSCVELFFRHPNPRIALETLRYISTSARAETALKVKSTNLRVILEIAKKEQLLSTYVARLALMTNSHTPLEAALKYVVGIRPADLKKLVASPEIKQRSGTTFLTARSGSDR